MTGWDRETPIPDNHRINEFLTARDGHLHLEDLDLAHLLLGDDYAREFKRSINSSLEIVYLPLIRKKIDGLNDVFERIISGRGYGGRFLYAYPSKANVAEEVIRTILDKGVHFEISSAVDTEIVRLMLAGGHLTRRQWVICNGFKPAGTSYSRKIIELQKEHGAVVPIVEDPAELEPLIESGLDFNVGVRQKSYGHHRDLDEMESANSRFGMNLADLEQTADRIGASSNLHLKIYHAMVGSQILDEADFVARLKPAIEIYAGLKHKHESLSVFNFGGGVPAPQTPEFHFDYGTFAGLLLMALQEVCDRHGIPVPDIMGEMGRYTVAEHGVHCFKVILAKENASDHPWYIINGSIMSSLPDTWALGDHFTVLPLNHLDKPFRRVQLGGITCDSDDVYPPKGSRAALYLPTDINELYIGFFNIGAYQEILGGVGGAKHCVIPESNELIVDRKPSGQYQFRFLPGQSVNKVLGNLGYSMEEK